MERSVFLHIFRFTILTISYLVSAPVFSQAALYRMILVKDLENQPISALSFEFSEINNSQLNFVVSTDESGEFSIPANKPFKIKLLGTEGQILQPSSQEISAGTSAINVLVDVNLKRINPVTITGSVQPRLASENPYSVQTISSKTIQLMAAQNLSDVLQNQSNIQLSNDPSLGTSIKLQGLGGQNVKILVNGVPMIGRLNGNIDISQIPTSNIERIEIIEGPMSVVYGTDAIGGVINIITKKPMRSKNSYTIKGYTDAANNYNLDGQALGSFNKNNQNINIGNKKSNPIYSGWSLGGGRQFFEGMDFNSTTRSMDWKPKTRLYGNAGLTFNTNKWKTQVNLSAFHEKLTDRSNAEYNLISVTGYNNYFNTNRGDLMAVTEYKLNDRNHFRFQNSVNAYYRTKTNVRRNLVTGSEVVTRPDDQDTTLNTQINLRGLWAHKSRSNHREWLWGYEVQSEQLETKRVITGKPITDAAIFGSAEFKYLSKLNVKPSLRIAYNNTFGKNPLPEYLPPGLKFAPIIPSLQIKYDVSKHLTLRSSYAQGFRAPNAKELYFFFVDINHNVQGNPFLKSEKSQNYIVSLDYRHNISKQIGATFKLSGFYNHIQNQIQLALEDPRSNLYRYINIGLMNSRGITAQSDLFIHSLNIQVSGSLMDNESRYDLMSGIASWKVAQATLNIRYEFPTQHLTLQMFSRFTGPTVGYTNTAELYKNSSYYLSDLSLSKKFWNNRILIQTGCKNLFNVRQINTSLQSGGVHGSGSSGINIGTGRNIFAQCIINL